MASLQWGNPLNCTHKTQQPGDRAQNARKSVGDAPARGALRGTIGDPPTPLLVTFVLPHLLPLGFFWWVGRHPTVVPIIQLKVGTLLRVSNFFLFFFGMGKNRDTHPTPPQVAQQQKCGHGWS
jgi:hypothetical protein